MPPPRRSDITRNRRRLSRAARTGETTMRRVVVTEFVSLDGVMEDPGGAEGTEHGGWSIAHWSDDIAKIKLEELTAADAMLLGRVTYEAFAAAWPAMEGTDQF